MYVVKTFQGQPARLSVASKFNLTGYSFIVQTSETENYSTPFERGVATLTNGVLNVAWNAAEVDEMTDRFFRIEATKSGSPTFYAAHGVFDYTQENPVPTAGDVDADGYLIEPNEVASSLNSSLVVLDDLEAVDAKFTSYRKWRGAGTTYPTAPVEGELVYRTDLFCSMMYNSLGWRQLDKPQLANYAAIAALPTAALHVGFEAWQTDLNRLWRWNGTKWQFIGGNIPAIVVRRTTAATYTINAWTPYNFESQVSSDTTDATMWAIANPARFYAPVDGIYQLTGSAGFGASAGNRYLGARKSGDITTLRRGPALIGTSIVNPELLIVVQFKLLAGDYCEFMYYTGVTGDNVAAFGTEQQPRADFRWVGTA